MTYPTYNVGFFLRRGLKFDHSCYGRDHAHQRIDLYPVEGSAFGPQSLFTYAGA